MRSFFTIWTSLTLRRVDCVKRMLTAKTKKTDVFRREEVLQLIHTNICGPITPVGLGGYK